MQKVFNRQPMESLPNRSDMWVFGGDSSSQTILNTLQLTKIKSWETSQQGVTVIQSTCDQSICCHKGGLMCEITSEMLKIPDLSKTGLADISDMTRKGKITIKPYSKIPDYSDRRDVVTKNVNWKGFVEFIMLHFLTKNNEFSFCRVQLQLICRQPFLDIIQATFQPVKGIRHVLVYKMDIHLCIIGVKVKTYAGMILNDFAEGSSI